MLKFAIDYEDQLNCKLRSTVFDTKYQYYNGRYATLKEEVAIDLWEHLQMVSIKGGEVVGYFSVRLNQTSSVADNFGAVSFTEKGDYTFSKDFHNFVDRVFSLSMRKLVFTVVKGNPAEKQYDRYIRKHCGRVVGVFKEEFPMMDGTYRDEKIYELKNPTLIKISDKAVNAEDASEYERFVKWRELVKDCNRGFNND